MSSDCVRLRSGPGCVLVTTEGLCSSGPFSIQVALSFSAALEVFMTFWGTRNFQKSIIHDWFDIKPKPQLFSTETWEFGYRAVPSKTSLSIPLLFPPELSSICSCCTSRVSGWTEPLLEGKSCSFLHHACPKHPACLRVYRISGLLGDRLSPQLFTALDGSRLFPAARSPGSLKWDRKPRAESFTAKPLFC